MPLVEAEALGTPETMHAVSSFHARETRAGAATTNDASSGKVDIATGWCLLVLSVALLVGSYLAAEGIEGGRFYISIGPFAYGMMRLFRGMDARKAYRAQQGRTEAS